jgi:hypothetical protein
MSGWRSDKGRFRAEPGVAGRKLHGQHNPRTEMAAKRASLLATADDVIEQPVMSAIGPKKTSLVAMG